MKIAVFTCDFHNEPKVSHFECLSIEGVDPLVTVRTKFDKIVKYIEVYMVKGGYYGKKI